MHQLGEVVIIGGGCYGSFYLGQLLKAREAGAVAWRQVRVVDRDPRCRAASMLHADVALHALTDAILGAIGDGDIGAHFPPSDPQWRGAPSRIFLEDAAARVRARSPRPVPREA